MPTILTHAAPALTLGLALGPRMVPPRLLIAGVACALAPDLDGIGFHLGVPYESLFGHRGLSHSLAAVALAGLAGWALAPRLKAGPMIASFWLALAVAGHIALDAATTGGLGPACFWPFDDQRYFLPWRFIRVSPMTLSGLLSARGLVVLVSELKWVWGPCLGLSLFVFAGRFWVKSRARSSRISAISSGILNRSI